MTLDVSLRVFLFCCVLKAGSEAIPHQALLYAAPRKGCRAGTIACRNFQASALTRPTVRCLFELTLEHHHPSLPSFPTLRLCAALRSRTFKVLPPVTHDDHSFPLSILCERTAKGVSFEVVTDIASPVATGIDFSPSLCLALSPSSILATVPLTNLEADTSICSTCVLPDLSQLRSEQDHQASCQHSPTKNLHNSGIHVSR